MKLIPILVALAACLFVGGASTYSQSAPTVTVTGVTPNHSSARVFYQPVAGAKDYRIYDAANPLDVKYAGLAHYVPGADCPGSGCTHHFATDVDGSPKFPLQIIADTTVQSGPATVLDVPATDIEWNGLGDHQPHTLVVEAVDALGPVPRANLYTGPPYGANNPLAPGGMLGSNKGTTGDGKVSTNGQGPYTNMPRVIAQSQPFIVQSNASITPLIGGTQPFLDTFENSEAGGFRLVNRDDSATDAVGNFGVMTYSLNAGTPKAWVIEYRQADNQNSMPFISNNHFMDMLFDGATPGTNSPSHTIYGSMAMTPVQTVDPTGGVLHLTMEVDAHASFRRWMAFDFSPANDPLQAWEAGQRQINRANQGLYFEMSAHQCHLNVFNGPDSGPPLTTPSFAASCGSGEMYMPLAFMENGRGLDDRSRLDFFVAERNVAAFQDNKLILATAIPAGAMPWFNQSLKAYYTHYLYHSDADLVDLKHFDLGGTGFCWPLNSYWFNDPIKGTSPADTRCNTAYPPGYGFPFSDERHWDNMGFEVLPAAADLTAFGRRVQVPPPQPPQFSGSIPPQSTPLPTVTPAQPTSTPMPTTTPEPSATPLPTVTPLPSATPETTVTPEPSASPTCELLLRLDGTLKFKRLDDPTLCLD